jgi:NAD(P)-dependent dehydrogenase (short-subunit alcohol dehydrogenase family)
VNKKKQKSFIILGRAWFAASGPNEQKFLRRFFQKAATSFLLTEPLTETLRRRRLGRKPGNARMSDLFRLDGKIAIITGSSRGIGRAIAETMASRGAAVVISSRKLEACEAARDTIIAQGGQAIALRCNTGSRDDLASLIRITLEKFGRLDAVVANVAVNPYYGPLSGISDEAWDKIMAVNLKSTLWLANLALPEIARQGGGSFTLISSIGALRGSTAIPAYNISKLAEIGLMQNLAVEWGRQNIRVNAILPGLVKTDFARALWDNPETLKNVEAATPLGRIGAPQDIGAIGAFLAMPAAAYITGQALIVDGGSTITGGL